MNMTLEVFFAGAGGTLAGSIIGAYLASLFQERLLQKQLDFHKQQAELDAEVRERILKESLDALEYLRKTINRKLGNVASAVREDKDNTTDR